MAYYDALIAEWALLTPGTTQQKLTQINNLNVTGSIPTLVSVTGAQIFDCLVYSEFITLTASQQTQVLQICAMAGPLTGGSASPFIAPWLAAVFAGKTATLANLVSLARGLVQPWWQANGYTSPIGLADLAAAGGLT